MRHFKTFWAEDPEKLESLILEWLKELGGGREINRSAPSICCNSNGTGVTVAVTVTAETLS